MRVPTAQGLYDPRHEHDACGVGLLCDVQGRKSPALVEGALEVLRNLGHRGACGCEDNTGDGAGILLQTPDAFMRKVSDPLGFSLPEPGRYAVGVVFLPTSPDAAAACEALVERAVREAGQAVIGWRTVPTDNRGLGASAVRSQPRIRQVFVARAPSARLSADEATFERSLYVARRVAER